MFSLINNIKDGKEFIIEKSVHIFLENNDGSNILELICAHDTQYILKYGLYIVNYCYHLNLNDNSYGYNITDLFIISIKKCKLEVATILLNNYHNKLDKKRMLHFD